MHGDAATDGPRPGGRGRTNYLVTKHYNPTFTNK